MCHDHRFHQQTGAGLPVALFIVTVLSLLVLGMSQLQEGSGKSISLQIQSQRAFFAAESGAQVAVSKVLAANNCSAAPSSLNFSQSGLAACSAALTCAPLAAGSPQLLLTSTGQCGSGVEQAERTIEVIIQ